jgi:hypothetical protein
MQPGAEIPEPSEAEWAAAEREAAESFRRARLDDSRLLLDDGRESGIREEIHFDESGDGFHLVRVEDVEGTLDWAKGRYSEGLANRACEFRHVGEYPPTVIELFAKKYFGPQATYETFLHRSKHDPKVVKALLADRDLSGFRVLAGHY